MSVFKVGTKCIHQRARIGKVKYYGPERTVYKVYKNGNIVFEKGGQQYNVYGNTAIPAGPFSWNAHKLVPLTDEVQRAWDEEQKFKSAETVCSKAANVLMSARGEDAVALLDVAKSLIEQVEGSKS